MIVAKKGKKEHEAGTAASAETSDEVGNERRTLIH